MDPIGFCFCKVPSGNVFIREPQNYAREHFHKSVREYVACARDYKNENLSRESQKCPWIAKKVPVNFYL